MPPQMAARRPQIVDALLAGRQHCQGLLQVGFRRPEHRVGRERRQALQRRPGDVAAGRQGPGRQDLPDHEPEQVARRRGQRTVERRERVERLSHGVAAVVT